MKETLKQVALAAFLFALVFGGGFLLGEERQEKVHDQYVLDHAEAAETAQRQLDTDIAEIGLKHEQELEYERKTINDLRLGLRDGTIRLRQAKAQCSANEDQRASVGHVERAEPSDGEQELGQDILDLAEHAKTAIAQRDALQEIIRKVNNED